MSGCSQNNLNNELKYMNYEGFRIYMKANLLYTNMKTIYMEGKNNDKKSHR